MPWQGALDSSVPAALLSLKGGGYDEVYFLILVRILVACTIKSDPTHREAKATNGSSQGRCQSARSHLLELRRTNVHVGAPVGHGDPQPQHIRAACLQATSGAARGRFGARLARARALSSLPVAVGARVPRRGDEQRERERPHSRVGR